MKYKIDKVNANEVYSDTSEEKEKQEHAYLLQDRLWKVFVLNLSLLVLNVFLLCFSHKLELIPDYIGQDACSYRMLCPCLFSRHWARAREHAQAVVGDLFNFSFSTPDY